jgi:hypothetical protein
MLGNQPFVHPRKASEIFSIRESGDDLILLGYSADSNVQSSV